MARRSWVEKPAIQKIFREHPIMAHVVMAESSGNPDAINKKSGAVGLAQLMPGTAKGGKDSKGRKTYAHGMYGKTLTDAEMRDPVKNLKFASEYLTALKKTFGNTEDALRAYNWGPGAVKKWIKQGRPEEKLPKETRNYVRKIRSRVGQTSPFVKAASAAERKRRGKPTEGVDPSAEARQLRLIKAKILKDRGEDKMATPAQIGRLEKEIQMDKKLGMSKANIATKQARLTKMRAQVKKVSAKQKAAARAKKAASYGGQGGLSPSDARSIAIAAKKENVAAKRKTAKDPLAVNIQGKGSKPTSTVREQQKAEKIKADTIAARKRFLAKQKAKATAKRTAALASMMDAPGSGKTRAARKVNKLTAAERRARARKKAGKSVSYGGDEPVETVGTGLRDAAAKAARKLAVDIQGKGSKPTSTVREQQKAEKIKADTVAARKRYLARQKAAADAKKARIRAGEFADTRGIKPITKITGGRGRRPSYSKIGKVPVSKIPTDKEFRGIADMDTLTGGGEKRRRPKPLEPQDSKVPVSREVKEREFLGFGGGIDPAAGVPFKILPKRKRKPIPKTPPPSRIPTEEEFTGKIRIPTEEEFSGRKIKKRKPKVVKERKPSDFERYGLTDQPIKRAKDIRIIPTKKKVRPARPRVELYAGADHADEYEKTTPKMSLGEWMIQKDQTPRKGKATLFGYDVDVDSRGDDYDVGHKHGGKVGKGKKKTKSRKRTTKGRKRAALRGHRAELRGG